MPSEGSSARGRADDLDPLHELGGDAVDQERPIVLTAGGAAAVDQHLAVARRQAAHRDAVELQHVGGEGDAGHALEHLAHRDRLEPLEVLEVVGEHGVRVGGPVTEGDVPGDDQFAYGGDAEGRCLLGLADASDEQGRDRRPQQQVGLHLNTPERRRQVDRLADPCFHRGST